MQAVEMLSVSLCVLHVPLGACFFWRGNCKLSFRHVLQRYHIQDDAIDIVCRALTPAEAIGANVKRHDFPIFTGKDVIPQNIGQVKSGITIEDGADLQPEVHFFGITAAGACALLGWKRLCFAHRYM